MTLQMWVLTIKLGILEVIHVVSLLSDLAV